ncbi:hypothetical protein ACB087_01160 [Vibrio sp. VNB-15]
MNDLNKLFEEIQTHLARANALMEKLKEPAFQLRQDDYEVANTIHALAMDCTDFLHVFTNYSPHVQGFFVRVYPAEISCEEHSKETCLMDECVFFESEDSLETLLAIESQLTELIIEASEKSEVAA